MSEEEKEAINKVLKEQIDNYEKYYVGSEEILPNISEDYRMSKIILNYIEKLQKENEKLKCEIEGRDCVIETQGHNEDVLLEAMAKKEKVIDLMAELLCGIDVMNELGKDSWNWNKEQIKEYFYKKAEE